MAGVATTGSENVPIPETLPLSGIEIQLSVGWNNRRILNVSIEIDNLRFLIKTDILVHYH